MTVCFWCNIARSSAGPHGTFQPANLIVGNAVGETIIGEFKGRIEVSIVEFRVGKQDFRNNYLLLAFFSLYQSWKRELTVLRLDVAMHDFDPIWTRSTICSSVGMIANDGSEAMKDMPEKGFRNSYLTSGREKELVVLFCNREYSDLPFPFVKTVQIIQGTMGAIFIQYSVDLFRPNCHPVKDLYNIDAASCVQQKRQICLYAVVLKPAVKLGVFASYMFRRLQMYQSVAISSQQQKTDLISSHVSFP